MLRHKTCHTVCLAIKSMVLVCRLRDAHDQELEGLGRKLTEAEREAAAANVSLSSVHCNDTAAENSGAVSPGTGYMHSCLRIVIFHLVKHIMQSHSDKCA